MKDQQMNSKKSFSIIIWIIIAVIILGGLVVLYFFVLPAKVMSYNNSTGIADLGVHFDFPNNFQIDLANEDKSFVKILSEKQKALAGLNYDEMVERKVVGEISDFPIYFKASVTNEIPFFARLRYLSGLGMSYPEKREEVDDFIPGYSTLEVVGNRGPGTFFITQNGQTIIEFYRPEDQRSIETFNAILQTFSFSSSPLSLLTGTEIDNFDLAFSDQNDNIWLMSTTTLDVKKITNSSLAEKLVAWLPRHKRIIHSPATNTGYYYDYYYTNVLDGTTISINKLIGKKFIGYLKAQNTGKLTFRNYDWNNDLPEIGSIKELFMSNLPWSEYGVIGIPELTKGDALVSPNEKMIGLVLSSEFPPNHSGISIYDIHNNSVTVIDEGKDIVWDSNSNLYYLKQNKDNENVDYTIARYSTEGKVSIIVNTPRISRFSISPSADVLTYVTFNNQEPDKIFQFDIINNVTTEIENVCGGQILDLVSGLGKVMIYNCYNNGIKDFYLFTDGMIERIPFNPRDVVFAQE